MRTENTDGSLHAHKRNSVIELLRIIAAVGVVILHYNGDGEFGGFVNVAENTLNQQYLRFSETLFICAVNLFVMISAYFLSGTQKRKLSKVVELVLQLEVFNLLSYVVGLIKGSHFSINGMFRSLLPCNYFVVFYLVLYVISPYINILIKNISKERFKSLVVLLFLLFPVWNFFALAVGKPSGLSTVTLIGSVEGYTIVHFVCIYFIGAYIRINDIKLSSKQAFLGFLACFIALQIEAFAEFALLGHTATWHYDHPVLVLIPAFLILLANNFNFESKIINGLAKAAFTSYLFHYSILPYAKIGQFVNRNIFILIAHQFGTAILIYLLSYLVYTIYNLITAPIFKRIAPAIDKCDISVNE